MCPIFQMYLILSMEHGSLHPAFGPCLIPDTPSLLIFPSFPSSFLHLLCLFKHKIIACKSHGIIYVVGLPSTCLRPCPTVFSTHVHVCLSCPQQLPHVTRLGFPQQQQLLVELTAILISSNHKAEAFTDDRLSLQCALITSIMIQATLYVVNFLSYVTI